MISEFDRPFVSMGQGWSSLRAGCVSTFIGMPAETIFAVINLVIVRPGCPPLRLAPLDVGQFTLGIVAVCRCHEAGYLMTTGAFSFSANV